MNKILVLGSTGMVGSRFVELHGDKSELLTPSHAELDVTSSESVNLYFREHKPDFVVNFVAYTNMAEAENQRGDKSSESWKINVDAVKNLAEASKENNSFLINISTDMVFSGSVENPGPYSEDDKPEEDSDKVTWYGYTKSQGEKVLQEVLKDNFAILRIIYPVRAKFDKKLDYVRKPLSLFDEGKLYPMFVDQQVSISFVDEVATALEKIILVRKTGIFHASSNDTATPHKLISYAIEKARGVNGAVKQISVDEFLKNAGSSVRYPKFGGLKVEKTQKMLGIKFSSWRQIVDKLTEASV